MMILYAEDRIHIVFLYSYICIECLIHIFRLQTSIIILFPPPPGVYVPHLFIPLPWSLIPVDFAVLFRVFKSVHFLFCHPLWMEFNILKDWQKFNTIIIIINSCYMQYFTSLLWKNSSDIFNNSMEINKIVYPMNSDDKIEFGILWCMV